jgi:hypothetical protein
VEKRRKRKSNKQTEPPTAPEKMKRSTGEEEIAGVDLEKGGAEADCHLFTPPPPLVTL